MRGSEIYLALTAAALLLMLTKRWTLPRGRYIVLGLSVAVLGFMRLDLPSIHCIAEGFFVNFELAFLKTPMLMKLGVAFLSAPLVGRVFCGYVCPKGAAQELIFIRRWRLHVPERIDRALRLLPYISLTALIVFPFYYGYRLWTDLDPFLWFFHFHGHLPGLVLLAILLPLSIFLCRPFCRYLCPLVPVFRLFSRIAPSRRFIDEEACHGCKTGKKSCDYDVISLTPRVEPRSKKDGKLRDACSFSSAECLQCGRCHSKCPKQAIR